MRLRASFSLAISLIYSSLSAVDFKINGIYTDWAQAQHAFNFDSEVYAHVY